MAMLKFRAPALPIAGAEYKQDYFAQLIRALALYFNQLDSKTPVQWETVLADNFIGGIFSGNGRKLQFPFISMIDNEDQTLTAALTPKLVNFRSTYLYNDFFSVPSDGAHVVYDGIYNYQYSLQLVNTSNSQHAAWIWLKVNGVDFNGSTTKFVVPARKTSTIHGYMAAVSNVVLALKAGDYVECWWAAEAIYQAGVSDGVYMEHYNANSDGFTHPSNPSALATITYVSALQDSTVVGLSALGSVGTVTVTITP
jgi:hypothetical protein